MVDQIQWVNALSTRASLEAAVIEVVEQVQQSISEVPDLGIVFISSAYASEYSRLVPLLIEHLPLPIIIGCGGGGIVGMPDLKQVLEVEFESALSLSVAKLPSVTVEAFHFTASELPDSDSSPEAWTALVGVPAHQNPQFILLSDPASQINNLLEGLDFAYPEAAKVGGLASSGSLGMPSGLFCYSKKHPEQHFYREGTVGVALSGNLVVETIVAQGCRPIGQPYLINKGERNIVFELAKMEADSGPSYYSPLEALRETVQNLSERDRALAQHALFVGVVRDEFQTTLEQGDFLIRNLLGVDPKLEAIAIGDRVRPGQRIQFHLRDAQTSAEDLELLLQAYQRKPSAPKGALLFSCLGRGKALYGRPNFDSEMFRRYLDNIPLGGFFCSGEIGPVGGRTFLHGYTSAFAIFSQP
ncbi:MAG: FIST C-terminal domain-containing protein [Cyanophyceae cyanobacterium]